MLASLRGAEEGTSLPPPKKMKKLERENCRLKEELRKLAAALKKEQKQNIDLQ